MVMAAGENSPASSSWWLHKQNVTELHNRRQFSNRKGVTDTGSTDEPQNIMPSVPEARSKNQVLSHSIHRKCPEKAN